MQLTDQEKIVDDLERARLKKTFDFDSWFDEYAKLNNWNEEDRKKAREYILDVISDLRPADVMKEDQSISAGEILAKAIDETK